METRSPQNLPVRTKAALALCAVGAERVVANELRRLGVVLEESGFGKLRFRTDTAGLYRALMELRAADRVLLEAAFFTAEDFDGLFEGTRAVPWEEYIPKGMGLTVAKVRTNRSRLSAETSIQSVVHKAAAERLCRAYGMDRLPEPGRSPQAAGTAELRVYIEKDRVSLLLDLSGEPLFKRGYRIEGGAAPLRETTAAAILLLSGWRRKFPLYDPFCGSGTILIEAAMYAGDMAPGLGRRFALEDLLIADADAAGALREELRGRVNFDRIIRIAGSDGDVRAVSIARSNLERALDLALGRVPRRGIRPETGQGKALPEIRTLPAGEARPLWEAAERGFIVTNPPYGKRMGDRTAAERTYGEMGELPNRFPGWKIAVITDHPGFESFFGRKADSCREITNGAVQSYFYQY
ncbi:MAG: class I SAM-dependent RNA methyltransferase [Treponema sp.]|jgi:putative N6-adenine-specific DNA methylase|nr:class I SAM-dependent RNA methyltransferase [Treponema sp.]